MKISTVAHGSRIAQLLGGLLVSAACVAGCGDDDGGKDVEATAGSPSDGGAAGTSAGGKSAGGTDAGGGKGGSESVGGASAGAGGETTTPAGPQVYVVAKHVSTGDAWTTYLDAAVVDSLADLESFDALDNGLEIAGYVIPVVLNGAVYVPDAVAPTVTRYDLNDANELVKGDALSFAGEGLTYVSQSQISVVNDDKAYLFDAATQRALIWNPSTMELTGDSIDLFNDAMEGYDTWYWADAARLHGDKLLVPANYGKGEVEPFQESDLVVIDTKTDKVSKFVADDRCQQIAVSLPMDNGDIYFFPNAGITEAAYTNTAAPRPPTCALRVPAGEDEFDDSVLELGQLAGGDETQGGGAQGAFPDGRGGFYFAVVDEQRYADREENGYSYYRLWHYDFKTAREVEDQDFWNGAMSRWTQFGKDTVALTYAADANEDIATVVYDTGASPLAPFSMSGTIEPITRIK